MQLVPVQKHLVRDSILEFTSAAERGANLGVCLRADFLHCLIAGGDERHDVNRVDVHDLLVQLYFLQVVEVFLLLALVFLLPFGVMTVDELAHSFNDVVHVHLGCGFVQQLELFLLPLLDRGLFGQFGQNYLGRG